MIQRDLFFIVQEAVKRRYDQAVQPVITDAQAGFGDFATNVAFTLAKPVGKPPREIATELAADIQHADIARVEAAGAGYLNITLSDDYWMREYASMDEDYGRVSEEPLDKIQVEYISANPTGPLTLANARGGFIGDVLSNVLGARGNEVVREYYVNDAGTQVDKVVESLKVEAGMITVDERQYQGEYLGELLTMVDLKEQDAAKLRRSVIATIRSNFIEPAITRLGLHFDHWQSEQELVDNGVLAKTLDALKMAGLTAERDGATWLLSERLGDERDRVIVRSDGQPTYLLGDLAYHYDIYNRRGFHIAIKLWGADHAGQVKSLKLGTCALSPQAEMHFVLIQFVRLMENGREVKMSKRAGVYVTIDELMETLESAAGVDHAAGVARWFFLSRSVDQRIDFDLELAREQSAKNPYYYVMYAYARAHSVVTKATEKGISANPELKLGAAELELVKMMAKLPTIMAQICADFGIHRLTFYGYELATKFQDYYEKNRIIDAPAEEAAMRLAFIQRYIIFMDRYWRLMGITPTARLDTN